MRTSELLVYGIILVVFLAFNVLRPLLTERLRRMQQRQQGQQELEQAQARDDRAPADEESWEETWGRSSQTVLDPSLEHTADHGSGPSHHVQAPARPGRLSRNGVAGTLFASREDLRQAVVVMTVLGPCRALEPHDRA
jgi:hypothetical protein